MDEDQVIADLIEKNRNGTATEEESTAFRRIWIERAAEVLKMGEELFDITGVKGPVPEKARIFESRTCSRCGERVGSHRVMEVGGRFLCIPCSENRGS